MQSLQKALSVKLKKMDDEDYLEEVCQTTGTGKGVDRVVKSTGLFNCVSGILLERGTLHQKLNLNPAIPLRQKVVRLSQLQINVHHTFLNLSSPTLSSHNAA